MNSKYATKEFFYRNLRSVMIVLKQGTYSTNMPFLTGEVGKGFAYLKECGYEFYSYAYVPGYTERDKNGNIVIELEGYLIPDEFIKEYVANH